MIDNMKREFNEKIDVLKVGIDKFTTDIRDQYTKSIE
jgi:hypothetical protein